jgi:hypothetical protein
MANAKDANEALWSAMVNDPAPKDSAERAAFNLAEQNADDTSVEQGFEGHSPAWYASFASSYKFSLDTMTDDTRESWSF